MFRHLLASLGAVVLLASALAEVPTYRVQFLGAGWSGAGLNELGDVCGNFSVDGTALRAGVSIGGEPFVELPLPPGMQTSRAADINNDGVIVGAVCPNQYVITQPTAAVWRPTADGYEVEVLSGLPADPFSIAFAINNVGDILGASGFWGWNPDHGLLFTENGPERLPGDFLASDINDNRVVVAGNRLLDLNTGELTVVPLPPGNWQGVAAGAINNQNDFCGHIIGFSGCSTFPLRYRQGVGWEFLGGCATTTSATSLNDHGDALLFYYTTASGVDFVGDGYHPLGSLIDPSQGLWLVPWGGGVAINNAHQILATVRQGLDGPTGAALLSPLSAAIVGDLNCDGVVTVSDIGPFVMALTNPAGYVSQFPECEMMNADLNADGAVSVSDIGPFVALLAN